MPGWRARPEVTTTMSGAGRVGVVVRADDPGIVADDRRRLGQVEGLALGQALDDIDQDDIGQAGLDDPLGGRGSDVAGADDSHLVAAHPRFPPSVQSARPVGRFSRPPVDRRHERWRHAVGVRLEVRREHPGEFGSRMIVGGAVLPGVARLEELGRHVRAFDRHANPKRGSTTVGTSLSWPLRAARTIARVWLMFIRSPVPYGPPVQPVLTSQTGTSQRARRSTSRAAYSPGVAGHERRPEAGRERCLRFLDPDLGAGQLGRVAADEVVGGLVVGQPGDRGQDAERIGRQQDHVLGLAGDPGRDRHCR